MLSPESSTSRSNNHMRMRSPPESVGRGGDAPSPRSKASSVAALAPRSTPPGIDAVVVTRSRLAQRFATIITGIGRCACPAATGRRGIARYSFRKNFHGAASNEVRNQSDGSCSRLTGEGDGSVWAKIAGRAHRLPRGNRSGRPTASSSN